MFSVSWKRRADFTPKVDQIPVKTIILKPKFSKYFGGRGACPGPPPPPTTQDPGQDAYYSSHLAYYSKPFWLSWLLVTPLYGVLEKARKTGFGIRAISVSRVTFNVEFTRRAVSFFLNRTANSIKSLSENKRFVFLWAAPIRKRWKPFES